MKLIRHSDFAPQWPTVPLGEVVEFLDSRRQPITKKNRIPGPYPYYGANGQQDSVADYIFDEPLVLLAEDGGHFGDPSKTIAYRVSGKCWVNNHAHVLRPGKKIDLSFLCRHLERYDVTAFITGTTRGKLTKSSASRIPLALPPLAEQKRIAAILDKADAVRRKRQEAIRLTEEFLRSVFLDMFGDPVTNPKGWDCVRLGKHLKFVTSGSRGWAKYYSSSGPRFIRSLDVQMNFISDEEVVFVAPPTGAETDRTRVSEGDVLLTITGSRIGRVAPVARRLGEAYVSQHVAILRLDENFSPRFVSMFLSHPRGGQHQIRKMQYGQTKPGLNLDQVKSFELIAPTKEMQKLFEDFWDRFGRHLINQQAAESNSSSLFKSIMSTAFKVCL